jgi:hypothetical protein
MKNLENLANCLGISINQQIELGIIRPQKTDILWQYKSKNDDSYKNCKGWDNGCRDVLLYQRYGYKTRAIQTII